MKIAVFGVWHVHAPDYTRKAQAHGEVIGFYEKDDALAEGYAKEFGLYRFKTPEELLASDAEGVIVCSASCNHAEDLVRIANAKKHIFTEKVLTLTDEEAARVRDAVEANGVTLTISLFQKYVGSRIAVKQVVDSGELGKINYVRFRNCHSGSIGDWLPPHFYNAKECGGGAMIDLGAHGMYIIHWILGMPVSASSAFTRACENPAANAKNIDGVEDNAVTVMSFENGAIAVNETGFCSNCSPIVLEVHGEKGYVRMEDDYAVAHVVKRTQATRGKLVEVPVAESEDLPILQFVKGNILPGCGMDDAIALTHMMVMAYK